jgi:hypothetical protein
VEHAHADEVHTSAETLVFEFACPRCGATIALGGRVVLIPDRRRAGVRCLRCDQELYLAVLPPED